MTERPENILYDFIFPNQEVCREVKLYINPSDKAAYSFEKQALFMEAGGKADFLTYFNAFSAGKWKKFTNVSKIGFFLLVKGHCDLEITHLTKRGLAPLYKWSAENQKAAYSASLLLETPEDGFLGMRIEAITPCEILGGGCFTLSPPLRHVHAAVCVATFRREELVKKTVSRLARELVGAEDKPDIVIVDNGASLNASDVPEAALIWSKNLGGCGGFTRALLHCEETGSYTHCLFMDDDAVCEAGSILRAISFLSRAYDDSAALAGAMLCAGAPWRLWECGCRFNLGYKPIGRDLDLRERDALLNINEEPSEPIFGAWWFFIFPIARAGNLPFPFFVHGDDVDFSYNNDFRIITLNGVCAWHEDFKSRFASHSVYFRARSKIAFYLLDSSGEADFYSIKSMLKRIFDNHNDAYFYGGAACVNLAIKHVLSGPSFWEENAGMEAVFPILKKLTAGETPRAAKLEEREPAQPVKLSFAHKLIRKLSFNGHLLPSWFLGDRPGEFIPVSCSPSPMRAFMRRKTVISDGRDRQVSLERNFFKYFYNLIAFMFLSSRLERRWPDLSLAYRKRSPALRSRAGWRKRLKME